MKIFLFLFFIAIISNNQKNEPIEIIKCVLSNEKLKNDLNSLKFQIENLIKEGDYSNLISLLKIFSMVEEVKSCFKNPSQLINNEEIVLKDTSTFFFFDCLDKYNLHVDDLFDKVKRCWDKLPIEYKLIIITAGADLVDPFCREKFKYYDNVDEMCSVMYQIIHSYEK